MQNTALIKKSRFRSITFTVNSVMDCYIFESFVSNIKNSIALNRRYQILEARVNGADTLLLIVAILGVRQLADLMQYSRSLGTEDSTARKYVSTNHLFQTRCSFIIRKKYKRLLTSQPLCYSYDKCHSNAWELLLNYHTI